MAGITLKQLRYFEALARMRHFGHAADHCAISQPALSVQIKELETTLGQPLFERSARAVRLTALGEDFAGRARDILRAVDELGDLARAAGQGLSGRLRLGVIPTIAPYLLPQLIRAASTRYAGLDLSIRETITPRLLDELARGRLDAALLALPVSEPGLTEMALFEEEMLLVRPAADAGHPPPTRADLQEMKLLLLEEGHCFRDQALSFCNIQSALSRDGLDGSSLSTLVQMVGAGMGVTLIPEMATRVETTAADVSLTRLGPPRPTRSIGMVWRNSSPLAGHLRDFAALVGETARPA